MLPSNTPVSQRQSRHCRLALIATLVVATAVRLTTLQVPDYWLDELHSLLDSAAHRGAFEALPCGEILHDIPRFADLADDSSTTAVWRGMRDDSHPPLYFLILNAWRRLLGDGEFIVRLPSAVLSILSILPVALLLRSRGRPWCACGTALLLALGFAHIQMGQQARPYSLSALLVTTSFWLLLRIESRWVNLTRGSRLLHAAAYATTLCLAMLTHYFAALALLAHVIYAAARFRHSLLRWWSGAVLLAAVAFCAIWLPSLRAQMDFISNQDWVRDVGGDHIRRTLIRAADLPIRLLFNVPPYDWTSNVVWLRAAGGLVLLLVPLAIVRRSRCRESVVFALWYLTPLVLLTAIDLLSDRQLLSHLRYSSIALPGLAGLLALATGRLRPPVPFLATGILVLLVALTLRIPATTNPEARIAAATLEAQRQPGDLVVFDAIDWLPVWTRREFGLIQYYMPQLDAPILMLNKPPNPETVAAMRSNNRILVVSPRLGVIPNHTPETHEPIGQSPYINGIGWIYLFERRPTAPATD